MAGWLGKAASVVMVFIATWGATILYWRNSGTVPTGMQMLAYLGLLPVGLSGAGFMLRSAARRGADAALAKAGDDAPGPVTSATRHAAEPAQQVPAVALLAGELKLGVDLDPQALLAVAAAPPRPALDGRFRDNYNLPLRMSAAPGLDEFEVLQVRQDGIDTAAHERRALALLQPVLERLLEVAFTALPEIEASEEVVVAGLRRRDEQRVENVLTLELLVPGSWSDALRPWVQDWLLQQARAAGLDARRFDVCVTTLDGTREVWPHVQRVIDALHASSTPRWHLLLAAASSIDPGIVSAWEASGVLATAKDPDGRVPGEGASGVLLASTHAAREGDGRLWRPQLVRAEQIEGQRPAEQRRQLAALASQWHAALGADSGQARFVLHDADHRGDLMVDAAAIAATLAPDLDFSPQSLALALSAGELGPVLPVAQLALAHAQLQRQSEPVLLLGVADNQQRLFGLVDPLPSPTLAADAPSAS
ncbi:MULTISPECIES: hypothetical protein [unclassified Stenotrophomonas]|uniref:hypothetical protein n=1 Tax=unclassified Stenotrophomonas TaxID=196198 RepID=UPI000D163E1C|nr:MULTISPECIES: hypothetical protein [unclassified Stenotrophomonas]PTA73065.1 hypothetical protein C9412_06405 [Stenotrophomonas sp. Nf1]PTA76805.1 hypothetical protein C9416_16480 [Stenotrophomonas sp. Nf4]